MSIQNRDIDDMTMNSINYTTKLLGQLNEVVRHLDSRVQNLEDENNRLWNNLIDLQNKVKELLDKQ